MESLLFRIDRHSSGSEHEVFDFAAEWKVESATEATKIKAPGKPIDKGRAENAAAT